MQVTNQGIAFMDFLPLVTDLAESKGMQRLLNEVKQCKNY